MIRPGKVGVLLLLRSQLYLWGPSSSSAFPAVSLGSFFFFCVPSYISGVLLLLLRSQLYLWGPSSSAFPAMSLGFTSLFLLLLRSQLYLWGLPVFFNIIIIFFFCFPSHISGVHRSSSSSSAFPAISLGFTIEDVVFLLPSFTRLGRECRDLLSPCDGMHLCTDYTRPRFILLPEGVFRERSQNPCQPQGKNPLYWRLRGGWKPRRSITEDSEPNTQPTELFRPLERKLRSRCLRLSWWTSDHSSAETGHWVGLSCKLADQRAGGR